MEQKERNNLISLKTFRQLASVHDTHCISIYLPTERAGKQVDQKHGQLRLKNHLKDLRSALEEKGLNENEIKEILTGPKELLEDVHFWRNQSDGLALFLQGSEMQFYTLPLHFESRTVVADHFYLLPLIPFFNDDGRFYLLVLSLSKVELFECSSHSITEVFIEDLTPENLEDVVGTDYKDKSLQHRSGQGGGAGAMFHGQGAGKDDKKMETEKFFRAVDDGLMKLLHNEDVPLLLACVDHHHPLYREITGYQYLFEKHIGGNPDNTDPLLLHEEAWLMVEDHFRNERESKKKQIQDLSAGGRTTGEIGNIVPASVEGRVDTLFIQDGKDRFGVYDGTRRSVIPETDADHRSYRASLYNLAAVSTIRNGGQVFLAEADEMPLKDTEIQALFRY
ncbi:MAG: hypothetical protein JW861_10965 [Bacteroidales bacterium]|nr:hypothetical protein [Bacteroidales bacterium]